MNEYLNATAIVAVCLFTAAFLILLFARWRMAGFSITPLLRYRVGKFSELASLRLGGSNALLQCSSAVASLEYSLSAETNDPNVISANEFTGSVNPKQGFGAAAIDGTIPGVEVWEKWHSVDSDVFRSFEHLSHVQISNVGDLIRAVQKHDYDIGSQGFKDMLRGHIGEFQVLDHLHVAGSDAAMPWASNNRGWDLLVSGKEVQVKTVADAGAAIREHSALYPEIPVIVPHDAVHIPADAFHFDPSSGISAGNLAQHRAFVDDALSHAEAADQAENATSVIQDPGPHLHIPWVTLCLSSYREATLWLKGHTTLLRASANTALNAAGVSGGTIAGAKLGFFVGGPAGAIIGGIGGAIAGRKVTNFIKRVPLETAKQDYFEARKIFQNKATELSETVEQKWSEARQLEGEKLLLSCEQEGARLRRQIALIKESLNQVISFQRETVECLLSVTEKRIDAALQTEYCAFRQVVPHWAILWAGLLVPSQAKTYRFRVKEAKKWKRLAKKLILEWSATPTNVAACFDLILAVPDGLPTAEAYLVDVVKARYAAYSKAEDAIKESIPCLLKLRMEAVSRLKTIWKEIIEEADFALTPSVKKLEVTWISYTDELRKAGVELTFPPKTG